jgi:hypothetical protein
MHFLSKKSLKKALSRRPSKMSWYDSSLRWHYPHQVGRVETAVVSSQPAHTSSPVICIYDIADDAVRQGGEIVLFSFTNIVFAVISSYIWVR